MRQLAAITPGVLPPPPLLLGRAPALGRRARPPLRQVCPDARAQLRVGFHLSHGQLGAAEGVGGLQHAYQRKGSVRLNATRAIWGSGG